MGTFSLTLQEVIDLAEPEGKDQYQAIGLDTYPIFDDGYRGYLNDKIIAHFNEQEIGHETDGMFRYAMRRKMNEIMPLFNQHYTASRIDIDPLLTVNIKNIGANTETSESASTSTADGRVVGSNTPQVRLAGNADYATSSQDSISKTDAGGTATQNVDTDTTTTGYSGNPAELVWSLRQSFVNVDMMVIDSLQELFMSVWDNGDEYTMKGLGYDYYPFGIYRF